MPVTEALSAVLAGAEPLPEEMTALDAAHHRVLARDVAARRTQPPQAMWAVAGEAVRIFPGGVIPEGADAVIIQEDTVAEGGGITITEAAVGGRHIRPAGVDFNKGDVLLTGGTRLSDRDLSLAAGMNYPELAVGRR